MSVGSIDYQLTQEVNVELCHPLWVGERHGNQLGHYDLGHVRVGYVHGKASTVNLEIFAVKIFSQSVLATKIKHAKIKRTPLMYTVRGRRQRKFIYTKIYSTKYF